MTPPWCCSSCRRPDPPPWRLPPLPSNRDPADAAPGAPAAAAPAPVVPPADSIVAGIAPSSIARPESERGGSRSARRVLRRDRRHRRLGFDERPDEKGKAVVGRDCPRRKLGSARCRVRRSLDRNQCAQSGSSCGHRNPGGARRPQVRALCPRRPHQSTQHLAAHGPAADAGTGEDGAYRHRCGPGSKPEAYLTSLRPKHQQFEALRQMLIKLRGGEVKEEVAPPGEPSARRAGIPMGRVLKPGGTDPPVALSASG